LAISGNLFPSMHLALPLTNLLRNKIKVCFTDKGKCILIIKRSLKWEPVLKMYNIEAETELHTNASAQGYAAILL